MLLAIVLEIHLTVDRGRSPFLPRGMGILPMIPCVHPPGSPCHLPEATRRNDRAEQDWDCPPYAARRAQAAVMLFVKYGGILEAITSHSFLPRSS